jgi:AbrB family looped-hinge helix DNA binding protein
MTTTNEPKQEGAGAMSLVRVKQKAQITLPAEARKALRVKEGDYLEAEVVEGGVLLKPVAVIDRSKAWDELLAIIHRDKGVGPDVSDDELMAEVVEAIHQARQA